MYTSLCQYFFMKVLKDDTDKQGKDTCEANKFQLQTVQCMYKGVIVQTYD